MYWNKEFVHQVGEKKKSILIFTFGQPVQIWGPTPRIVFIPPWQMYVWGKEILQLLVSAFWVVICRYCCAAGYVSRMVERRGVYRVLVGRSEGKRPLGRHRRRWEDNIRMNLQRMRWAEHVTRMVERRGVYRVLVGRSEGKRPLGRQRLRWEDNIKMNLQRMR